MKILMKNIIALFVILTFTSCGILQQVTEMKTFGECEFEISRIENVFLAGVDIQGKNDVSDLDILDGAKIISAFAKGELPLMLDLYLTVKNSNNTTASMNKLEWVLYIDDIEMLQGVSTESIQVPANNGVAELPLHMNMDLLKVLSSESRKVVLNFGFNLAGKGTQKSRIMIKAKPTILIGNSYINYPGYITIKKEI